MLFLVSRLALEIPSKKGEDLHAANFISIRERLPPVYFDVVFGEFNQLVCFVSSRRSAQLCSANR